MKFLYGLFVITILTSCLHKKVVVKRLDGNWSLEKYLLQDGTYTYFNDFSIEFEKGKADGETYLTCHVDSAGVVTEGKYLVFKNGEKMIINYDISIPSKSDTFSIEDQDKKSMVLRDQYFVHFYKKN